MDHDLRVHLTQLHDAYLVKLDSAERAGRRRRQQELCALYADEALHLIGGGQDQVIESD